MHRDQRRNTAIGRQGFTLIELLIAVSIFSIIVVTLYSAFSVVMHGYQRIQSTTRKELNILPFTLKADREFRNAVLYGENNFIGEKEKVTFFSIVGDGSEHCLCRISYVFNGGVLKRYAENLPDGANEEKVVARDIGSVTFSYAVGDEYVGYSWVGVCTPVEGLPKAVRIDLTENTGASPRHINKIWSLSSGGWER